MNFPPELELIILAFYRKGLNYRRFLDNKYIIEYSLDFPHRVVDDEFVYTCPYHGWIFGYIDNELEFSSRTYFDEDYFMVDRGNGDVYWLPYNVNDAYIDAEDMHWN